MEVFNTIYTSGSISVQEFLIMLGVAIASGFIYSIIMSIKMQSTKRMFVVDSIMPAIIGSILTFVNGNIGAGVAIGGAFALIRFRSAQGTADELISIFIAMASGVAYGMGYVAYGSLILIGFGLLYVALTVLPIFKNKNIGKEKLIKITIPETLEYTEVFNDIFDKYLSLCENVGVKTVGMGSMYRLSYKIKLKNPAEEKAFIDELRTKNGNLEISIVPFVIDNKEL